MSPSSKILAPSDCLGFHQLNSAQQILFKTLFDDAQSWKFLVDKPEETPLNSLCALWHKASGAPLSSRIALDAPLSALSDEQIDALQKLFAQRSTGAPLSHLVERQHFMGLELLSSTNALIPRVETEMLAELCIELIGQLDQSQEILIIDQFTGSGNIPLCFAKRFPHAKIFGGDISADCIALAEKNAQRCKLEQVQFKVSDMFAAFDNEEFVGKAHLISGAPPYISSKKVPEMHTEISQHEPTLAFDAGPFGIAFFVRLIQESPKFLAKDGWLAMEVGLGQGPSTLKLLEKSGHFGKTLTRCDKEGNIRVVAGQKHS